jgi:nitroreductase
MDYFDAVRQRRSVRAFASDGVEPEKISRILETIDLAPSAGNLQSYEVYQVTRRSCLDALARASFGQQFVAQVPVAFVFCAHPARASKYGRRGASLYSVQDASIACAYAQLAATALGLGTVWVGAFSDDAVRKAIGVGEELVPVAILPVGYAAEHPDPSPRRSLQDLVHPIP